MTQPSLASCEWLNDESLQALLAALSRDDEEARIVGGAVRNALMGQAVTDIDIATTTRPEETTRRAEAAGFRVIPTGVEHGTVTALSGARAFEITTLRADVRTDGRHAEVAFGRDWAGDAARRDFTINGLYAGRDGAVVDLVGGLRDLETRTVRFIGDADKRIREDYLRILRFFRFFAWYGGGRPDAEGLKACTRLRDGIASLSAERVWKELRKLLSAPDPSRALLWMRQSGVLTAILPESEKWGIDAIHALVRAEADLGWEADPMLRLAAILPPDAERLKNLAERLKMSRSETRRLLNWAAAPLPSSDTSESVLARTLYRGDAQAVRDRLRLAQAAARAGAVSSPKAMAEAGGFARLLAFTDQWKAPIMPVRGADLLELGLPAGPELGRMLGRIEDEWVSSGFSASREDLLANARQLPGSSPSGA